MLKHFFEIYDELALWEHISMERMLGEVPKINSHASRFNVLSKQKLKHPNSHLKLRHLLHIRGIRLHILPLTTPSIAFEKNVCGVQYAFTSYLAARFAADYQAIMYIDGDSAVIEHNNRLLKEILYKRFFSPKSNKCVGHRFRLLEQFVKPEDESNDRVLECSRQLSTNQTKWNYVNRHCNLKKGHIAVRADSIFEFNVHHPDTLREYLLQGVQDCIMPGNEETKEYFFGHEEVVQIHLRNRKRKAVCTCFTEVQENDENESNEENDTSRG